MAVAQALAKAAEGAAVATKRAADILHSAGERMGQQGLPQENSASGPRPSTGDTGTAAAGQRGRLQNGQATPKAARKAALPTRVDEDDDAAADQDVSRSVGGIPS